MGRMLGERLTLARVEKDVNVAALSKALDISASHIHRIEDGDREPSYKILVRLANALDLDINELSKIQMLDRDFPSEEELQNADIGSRNIEDIRKEIDYRLDKMGKTDLAVLDNLLSTYFF